MAERTYYAFNGAQPTTAEGTKVTTGTSLKTMMQIQANPSGPPLRIIEWGCSFDGSAAATPGTVELIETGTVGATVTAYKMPVTYVTTAISSGATTTLVVNAVNGFGASNSYSIIVVNPIAGTRELMEVTAGANTTSWTVTRNLDGRGAIASFPVNSPVYGYEGAAFQSDIAQQNSQHDFPYSSVALAGTSGFTSTAEGSITELRYLAPPQLVAPTNQDIMQMPLAREAEVRPGCYARIRMHFGAAINAFCYICWAE